MNIPIMIALKSKITSISQKMYFDLKVLLLSFFNIIHIINYFINKEITMFQVNLEVTVLDYDRIGGSDPIGKVMLGYNRKKLEKKHWVEMVENPRRPIIHWHV